METDKKISEMPRLAAVSGDEIIPVVSNGTNQAVTTKTLKLALLIDEWKNEMGADGGYNETSGLFTAYDILDLTAAEVMTILGWRGAMLTDSGMAHYTPRVTPRTVVSAEGKFSMAECWINCSGLQVISNIHGYNYITARDLSRTWAFCTALRTIKPVVYCSQLISCDDTFKGCAALQDVKIEMIDRSISFADSPMLTTSSVAHLVEHSANTAPITVTLHPTAYGNLTQDILTLADQNRITFAIF